LEIEGVALKKIKFTIESDLDNVSLIGMSVRKVCSLTPFPEKILFLIELCVVEAVNNSIIHAYNGALIHEVEVILSINEKYLLLEVNDKGKPMNSEVLEKANISNLAPNIELPETISESGRGLAVIKECMDKVSYRSDNGKNRLIMIKNY
jgi:serine/threonine-protein kinase RsbW